MKFSSLIATHPFFSFIFLVIAVLVLPNFLITWCYNLAKDVKGNVDVNIQRLHSGLVLEIESTATLLQTMNSSAANLARIIFPLFNGIELSESDVDTKVAPLLFQAFSVIPHISQVSYIGLDGPFFSYYIEGNQTFAMYTNTTTSSNSTSIPDASKKYPNWYKQAVDPNTGKPYGGVIRSLPFSGANTSWINEALNSTYGYASLGSGWNSVHDPLFLNSVSLNGKGIISLGFSVSELMGFFSSSTSSHNGSFYLATQNGDVLLGGLPNTRMIVAGESVSLHWLKSGEGGQVHIGNVSCKPSAGRLTTVLNIGGEQYDFCCSLIEIVGVQSVYALAFPRDGVLSEIQRRSKIAFVLSILTLVLLFISISSFILLIVRAMRREMQLRSVLIRQMEAIQQAERKSMNKSNAFASASHDIRSALACIIGLVDLSLDPRSNLETNLTDIRKCANELEGILNSVLDTSKIEAGKMPLEEEEFDIAELVEDAVDLYYPVGIQKGIDVVLDPCDGSIANFRHVKGDSEKLKKIIWNLLSNAVKFTCQGYVTVRARARKCRVEEKMIASSNLQTRFWTKFWGSFRKNKENHGEAMESVNPAKQSPNCVEYVFEVDDTGIGIPKDKRESVFENYVQVKEKALQVEGTGLGLGIVQSLVRLMGGEIEIVDKDSDEQGTCFRFNVFLETLDASPIDRIIGDTDTGGDLTNESTKQYMGLTIRTPSPGLTIRNSSPRLNKLGSSPRVEGSHVILLIANEQRRKVSQKYFERFGIKVSVIDRWDSLHSTLKKIKRKHQDGSSGKSDVDSWSESSSAKSKELPLSSLEGTDQKPPLSRSATSRRTPSGFILLVIDATAGPFEDIYRDVAGFRRGLTSSCKVVWLGRPTTGTLGSLDDDMDLSESNLSKPFHGSRLDGVRTLLPEFGGASSFRIADETKEKSSNQTRKGSNDPGFSSRMLPKIRTRLKSGEIQLEDSSGSDVDRLIQSKAHRHSPTRRKLVVEQPSEIEEVYDDNVLGGMKFLVVDDTPTFRMIAKLIILQHGGIVELCEDGQQALELVRKGLQEQHGPPCVPPYDFILMDCQMPRMDGCEATRLIRKEEKLYGIHIPIIASSAHESSEVKNMLEAGMDAYVPKRLTIKDLIEAITSIHQEC